MQVKTSEAAKEHNEFSDCVEARIRKIREVLAAKAEMYASTSNRLHNFDFAARILNCTPEQALQGMLIKHIVSVLDLIEWTETMPARITEALIDEKIGDTINYLILLESLFLRRILEGCDISTNKQDPNDIGCRDILKSYWKNYYEKEFPKRK